MARAFVDLESTGLDPQLHEPWEIAAIVEDHADPALNGEWCWQVRPDLTGADPDALKIGGYWKRLHTRLGCSAPGAGLMLATHGDDLHPGVAVNAGEIADRLAGLLAGAELVGVNVQFDAAFLAEFLRRNNQAPSWDYHLTEMCSMARGWLHRGPIDYEHLRRSDDLSRACDVAPPEPEERHTALGDARWVQRWYGALTNPPAAEPRPRLGVAVEQLADAAQRAVEWARANRDLAARLAANDTTVLGELDQAIKEPDRFMTTEPRRGGHAIVEHRTDGWVWRCDGWQDCKGFVSIGHLSSAGADASARQHLAAHAEIDQAQQTIDAQEATQ